MTQKKKVNIFGVTGSIGQSTVDVVLSQKDLFDVQAVSANSKWEELAQAAIKLEAKYAVITNEQYFEPLKEALSAYDIEVISGQKALNEAACMAADISVMAIMGMAGLEPLMTALEHSKTIAIANKEPLVAAGRLVMQKAQDLNVKILPLDSEHNAIFQVFENQNRESIERLILTASGGPFRKYSLEELEHVTLEQALKHPNWVMGDKITIDSASMMNKALEVIEAYYLFDLPAHKIDVLIHPQSIVHSMVEYNDGSILAQLGASDMRTPITYSLGWPERLPTPGQRLDFEKFSVLEFQKPDLNRFEALKLAYDCIQSKEEAACLALNAANEVAVEAFLSQKMKFSDIVVCNAHILDIITNRSLNNLDDILDFDRDVRRMASQFIETKTTLVA